MSRKETSGGLSRKEGSGGLSRKEGSGGLSRLSQENIAAAVLLVVFGGVVWLCQDFGPRARMIPLPLAVFGIVLTLIQIAWQNLRSTDELQMDLVSVAELPAAEGGKMVGEAAPPVLPAGERAPTWRGELRALGIVALLIGLILVVGLIPAVFVFTGGYFLLTRHYSWLMGLVYTSVFTASVHLLFMEALQIEPYYGLLAPLAERFR